MVEDNSKLNKTFSNRIWGFVLLLVGLIVATVKLFLLLLEQGADSVQLYATGIIVATIALAATILIFSIALVRHLKDIQKLALTDQLTGIRNRTALAELCDTPRLQSALKNGSMAVISLDLDCFKQINDDCGHCIGDLALKRTADRITGLLRQSDQVFRIGGDEFLCVLFDSDPGNAAAKVVERVERTFRSPMCLNGKERVIDISVGFSVASQGDTWETIFNRSDAKMYEHKYAKFTMQPSVPQVSLLQVAM